MTPLRALVRSGAAWFLPLLFVLSCLFATRSTVETGYAAADIAQSSVGLYVAAPLTAAFMALQYRGFTHLLRPLRQTRSGLLAAMEAWWPLLLGAPVTLCLAVMATGRAVPDDLSAWSLILIDLLTVLAAALTGLACAWALPTVVAVPLVAVLWFVWIGYGPASDSPLVHNLDSTFGCCTSETRPAMVAVRATLLLLLVITVGVAALLVSSRSPRIPRPLVAGALALVVVAAFGAGSGLLHASDDRLTLTATETRTTALSCRTEQDLDICLWPENTGRAGALASVVTALDPELRRRGLATIDRLTQAQRDPDAVSVEAGAGISDQQLRLGVASGYVDREAGCSAVGEVRDRLVALVGMLAGLTADDVRRAVGPTAATAAADTLDHGQDDPASVGAAFERDLHDVSCVRPR